MLRGGSVSACHVADPGSIPGSGFGGLLHSLSMVWISRKAGA